MKPFREMQRPALVLSGTKDGSDAGDRWRTLLPDCCHFMFVYDAERAIGAPSGRRRSFSSRANSSSAATSSASAGNAASLSHRVKNAKFAIVRPAPILAVRGAIIEPLKSAQSGRWSRV
jgi:hypothetical protein